MRAQKLAITADEAINRVIQSCKRARAQHIESMTVVPSRRFTAEESDGHELIYSPLNQTVTRNGVTVEVHIYKDDSTDWILEVVDAAGNSRVWDHHFFFPTRRPLTKPCGRWTKNRWSSWSRLQAAV